jgi:2-dehydro-3-deoxygluconokinase
MVRLSPPYDVPLERAAQLWLDTGGSEFGAMAALARLGVRAAWVSKLPDSPLGRFIAASGRQHGVDMSLVRWADCGRVGLYFVEYLRRSGRIRVHYDRKGSAINDLRQDEVEWSAFRAARIVHLSGITPALSENCCRLVHRAVAEAKAGRARVSFDVNHRSLLWSPDEAAAALEPLLRQADILISSAKDLQALYGLTGDPWDVAQAARERFGSEVVALTLGEAGSVAIRGDERAEWVGVECEEVDRFVAGDCFAGGLLYGLLHDDLQLGVRLGGAFAALKHTIPGDMPWVSAEEVRALAEAD